MKAILLTAAALVLSVCTIAQTYESGDKDLDKNLVKINTQANADLALFKLQTAKTYSSTEVQISGMLNMGMTPGDVVIAFEIGSIGRKPIEDVIASYKKNKGKGWGVIAKEMGIKPGSEEFHKLKGNCKNKADKKASSGTEKAKGNSGKGNGASKGNSGKGNSGKK